MQWFLGEDAKQQLDLLPFEFEEATVDKEFAFIIPDNLLDCYENHSIILENGLVLKRIGFQNIVHRFSFIELLIFGF